MVEDAYNKKTKEWLKRNWFFVSILVITVIVAFSFLNYLQGQNRIREQERAATEQRQKAEYIAKRRNDCFGIYDKEKDNWSNVKGVDYDVDEDTCYVLYTQDKSIKEAWGVTSCKDLFPTSSTLTLDSSFRKMAIRNYFDCTGEQFRNSF